MTRGESSAGAGHATRAVFLDRDGVLNRLVADPVSGRPESPLDPEDMALLPGAVAAIRELRELGLPLALISNQPAAAKGKVPLERLHAVHERFVALLDEGDVEIDVAEYCHHHPQGVVEELTASCECRKPRPGMILAAAHRLGVHDLGASWVIGDSDVDMEAASAVGARTVLVEEPSSAHRRTGRGAPDHRASDALAAARLVVADERRGG